MEGAATCAALMGVDALITLSRLVSDVSPIDFSATESGLSMAFMDTSGDIPGAFAEALVASALVDPLNGVVRLSAPARPVAGLPRPDRLLFIPDVSAASAGSIARFAAPVAPGCMVPVDGTWVAGSDALPDPQLHLGLGGQGRRRGVYVSTGYSVRVTVGNAGWVTGSN